MKLLHTDVLLERSACYVHHLEVMPKEQQCEISSRAATLLDDAEMNIDLLHYHRKRRLLMELRSKLQS